MAVPGLLVRASEQSALSTAALVKFGRGRLLIRKLSLDTYGDCDGLTDGTDMGTKALDPSDGHVACPVVPLPC